MTTLVKRARNTGSLLDDIFDSFYPMTRSYVQPVSMTVDVAQSNNITTITADVPGLSKEDIDISITDGIITISGERKEETESKNKDYYISERRYGKIARSFRLPDDVDIEQINATCTNGVLKISLPHIEHEEKNAVTKIAIKDS